MIGEYASTVEQAFSAVKVLLYVGPVAVYVLWLGLVSSQARPRMVRAREDFMALTVVFLPALVAVIGGFVRGGYAWTALAATALVVLLFLRLLPAGGSGWVVYNLSARRGRGDIERSLRSLGWAYQWSDRTLLVPDKGLSIELSSLPLLRYVAFHVTETVPGSCRRELESLRTELDRRFGQEVGLPTVGGCCLMLCGVALLILPLWMVSYHSAAIAELMTRVLLS